MAPHDHKLRIFGDRGVLELNEAWDNFAAVRFRRRFAIRAQSGPDPTRRIRGPASFC